MSQHNCPNIIVPNICTILYERRAVETFDFLCIKYIFKEMNGSNHSTKLLLLDNLV